MSQNKPILVKQGNISVKIYTVKNRTAADGVAFQVADYTSGKRTLQTFVSEREARARATDIAVQLARGDVDSLTLTSRDKSVYVHAQEVLRPTGISLNIAASHFAEAVRILGSDLVVEAAKQYARRHARIIETKTVEQVFDLMLADAQARGLSACYIEDLDYRCGKFAETFQVPIASVCRDDVRTFLAALKLSPRSHNNFLAAINRLFAFAKEREFLPQDHDGLAGIKPVKAKAGDIEIYTPEELLRLLTAAKEDVLPAIAIGAFAGLRSAEIERLDWSEVNFEQGFIEVKASKAKTAARRIVPLLDNLAAWLKPHAKKSGRVWPTSHAYFHERMRGTAQATGSKGKEPLKLKANALRHSFISYRVAATQNVNQVALESGNSAKMIFGHYREVVTPKQATAWFSIRLAADDEKNLSIQKV